MHPTIVRIFAPYSAALAAIKDGRQVPGMSIALDAVAAGKAKAPERAPYVPPFKENHQ
jgi:hypothetical protein